MEDPFEEKDDIELRYESNGQIGISSNFISGMLVHEESSSGEY